MMDSRKQGELNIGKFASHLIDAFIEIIPKGHHEAICKITFMKTRHISCKNVKQLFNPQNPQDIWTCKR